MKYASLVIAFAWMFPFASSANEGMELQTACKAECPDAKSEHKAHLCMKEHGHDHQH